MSLQKEFRKMGNELQAHQATRYFKTSKGQYAHGDLFLGIRSPEMRKFAKENFNCSEKEMEKFIKSKYHEERLVGLFFLIEKFKKEKDLEVRQVYVDFYIECFPYINNWDLVDVTVPHILGVHFYDHPKQRKIIYEWIRSDDLWVRRIGMLTNWWFVRKGDLRDVFKMSKILLSDEHDLIHKAVGWMLREAGKKDKYKLDVFLRKYSHRMPRTMLRYSIEKHPENERQKILKGNF